MSTETLEDQARYETLLGKHLAFYDSLRLRERRPRTAAQRHFQDVAWGMVDPVGEHEKAYIFHLRRASLGPFAKRPTPKHIDEVLDGYQIGARPVDGNIGQKWDEAWREHRDGREFW